MVHKVVLILGSVAAVGLVATGIILAVRMPQDAIPDAFTAFANATARGLSNTENGTF